MGGRYISLEQARRILDGLTTKSESAVLQIGNDGPEQAPERILICGFPGTKPALIGKIDELAWDERWQGRTPSGVEYCRDKYTDGRIIEVNVPATRHAVACAGKRMVSLLEQYAREADRYNERVVEPAVLKRGKELSTLLGK